MEDLTDRRQLATGLRHPSTATLRRVWQMITHVGLLDLMPAVAMTRIEEETHEHRAEGRMPRPWAADETEAMASTAHGMDLAESGGRMRQFAQALVEAAESDRTDAGMDEATVAGRMRRERLAVADDQVHERKGETVKGQMHEALAVRRRAADVKRASRPPAASGSAVVDRAAPEVSVDTAIEGLAGRTRQVSAEVADDEILRDMLAQRERAIEQGR